MKPTALCFLVLEHNKKKTKKNPNPEARSGLGTSIFSQTSPRSDTEVTLTVEGQ